MKDFGLIAPGETIYIEFDSFGADGQSITLTGLVAGDVEIYRDGSVTQRSSDSGITLLDTDGIDLDSITGIHGLSISLADNSDAGFYRAGSHYRVVISAVTINSQTVSFTAATFRIGYQAAHLNTTIASLSSQTSFTLTSGPAEDDALNGQWAIIHDVASAVQKAQVLILDYTGSTKTVTLAAGATFTAAATDNFSLMGMAPLQPATIGRTLGVESDGDLTKVNTLDGHTAQTGDSYAIVNSGTHGNAAIKTQTAAIETDTAEIGAAGAGLTNINLPNQTMDIVGNITGNLSGSVGSVTGAVGSVTGAVGSVAAGGISEASFATTAGPVAPLNIVDQGTAQSATSTTLVLRSAAAFADDELIGARILITGGSAGVGQSRLITDYVSSTDTATVAAWTTTPTGTISYKIFGNTASSGSAPTAGEVADAVWDEILSGHAVAGSTGEALAAAGSAGDPWLTALPGAYGAGTAGRLIGRSMPDIVAGSAGGLVIAGSNAATTFATLTSTGALTAGSNAIPWNASWDAEVQSECADALVAYDGLVPADLPANFASLGINASGHVSRVVLVDTTTTNTDMISAAGIRAAVGLASANLDTQLSTIDGVADSILVDTTQIKADLPGRPTSGVQLDNVMFMMVDATDGMTPETGVTVTATISKDGGAFAACTNAVSEVSGGWYNITLTSTEMTASSIAIKMTATGCAQRNLAIRTQPT